MLCDACKKNEATYHTIRQYNGIKTETHLCAECRRKFVTGGKSDFANAFFSDFSSVFGNAKKTRVCAECGTTEEEFLNYGLRGVRKLLQGICKPHTASRFADAAGTCSRR